MFALAAPGTDRGAARDGGLHRRRHESVDFAVPRPDLDAWWDHQTTVSVSLGDALAGLSPAEHYALRDAVDAAYEPFTSATGRCELPARALVAGAEA